MKLKISATFFGRCDICKKEKLVFSVGDEDSKKVVTLCKDCVEKLNGMLASEVVKKFGKKNEKAFE